MEKNQAVCRIYLQNLRDKTPPRGKNSGSLRLWRPLTHSPQWGSPMLLGCSSHLEIKIRGQVTPGSKTPHLLVEELPSSKPGYHSEILSSCGAQIKGPYFSFSKCPDHLPSLAAPVWRACYIQAVPGELRPWRAAVFASEWFFNFFKSTVTWWIYKGETNHGTAISWQWNLIMYLNAPEPPFHYWETGRKNSACVKCLARRAWDTAQPMLEVIVMAATSRGVSLVRCAPAHHGTSSSPRYCSFKISRE